MQGIIVTTNKFRDVRHLRCTGRVRPEPDKGGTDVLRGPRIGDVIPKPRVVVVVVAHQPLPVRGPILKGMFDDF